MNFWKFSIPTSKLKNFKLVQDSLVEAIERELMKEQPARRDYGVTYAANLDYES